MSDKPTTWGIAYSQADPNNAFEGLRRQPKPEWESVFAAQLKGLAERLDVLTVVLTDIRQRQDLDRKTILSALSEAELRLSREIVAFESKLTQQQDINHEFVVTVVGSLEKRIMEMQSTQIRWIELYEQEFKRLSKQVETFQNYQARANQMVGERDLRLHKMIELQRAAKLKRRKR